MKTFQCIPNERGYMYFKYFDFFLSRMYSVYLLIEYSLKIRSSKSDIIMKYKELSNYWMLHFVILLFSCIIIDNSGFLVMHPFYTEKTSQIQGQVHLTYQVRF